MNLKNRENSFFALKLVIGFPIAGLVWTFLIYFFSGAESLNFNIALWIGGTGVALGVLCMLWQNAYSLIFKIWNLLIQFIDLCITWTTLPFFYYFLFTPFAFALRIFGKASMKKNCTQSTTFWKNVNPPSSLKQYLRQF
jgi:hypothetical protein